jgi:hypothetical protein
VQADGEIPLLLMLFYLFHEVEAGYHPLSSLKASLGVDLRGRHCQVGSLAGAAHLLNNNAGVLR